MPSRQAIGFDEFNANAVKLWLKDWLLLTAGSLDEGFNPMTIAWGGIGAMWNKPVAMVVVRPQRHTLGYLERYGDFTLCVLPEDSRHILAFCGSHSGRESDKVAEAGLIPVPSSRVRAPGFDQADLILECRSLYSDDFRPERFMDPAIDGNYAEKDYHRMFIGEILAINGTADFKR